MTYYLKKGSHLSATTKTKISAKLKGKPHHLSAATRAKISAAMKGKHHPLSAAARATISAKLKGKKHPLSAAARARLSAELKSRFAARRAQRKANPVSKRVARLASIGISTRTILTPAARKRVRTIHRTPPAFGGTPAQKNTVTIPRGAYRLISATPRRIRLGVIRHVGHHHVGRIVMHRTAHHHRVWRPPRRSRR